VVTDCDPAEVALARAAFQTAYHRIPEGVTFETADALQLRYADASLDAVFASFVLHHPGDRMAEGLAEVDRVLGPRGQFVYAEIARRGAIRDFLASRGHTLVYRRRVLGRIDQVISRKGVLPNPAPA
jgi:ubiquinone/menaquinone biosynthesis C-methylase UbiE